MIELNDIHKSYSQKHVLKGIDLSLNAGTITAILGPNGSGKTTLIKSIIGMVIPEKGSITVNGHVVGSESRYRKYISYLPQMAKFPDNLKVREIIEMVADLRRCESDAGPLLENFQLKGQLEQPLKSLSGGMLQKVNLLLTLMINCDYVILDEPTTGLDPMAMQRLRSILKTLKDEQKTVLFTTHIMSFAEEMADRIIYLLDGKVYFDGDRNELLHKYQESDLEAAIARLLESYNVQGNGVHRSTTPFTESIKH